MSTGKRARGAPTKAEAQENKRKKTEAKLVDEILKTETLIVDNYYESVDILIKAMKGEIKGVSPTNVLSSAKVIKAWGDEIMAKREAEKNPEAVDTPKQEQTSHAPLISLVAQGED